MAAKTQTTAEQTAHLACYDELIGHVPGIERKGATMPYTSLNGHMFSFLDKDGTLALRLPEKEREAFIKKYKTKLHESYGTVLKEYVSVPPSVLKKDTSALKKYFEASYTYVQTLKPKPTKKAAPKKAVPKKAAIKKSVKK